MKIVSCLIILHCIGCMNSSSKKMVQKDSSKTKEEKVHIKNDSELINKQQLFDTLPDFLLLSENAKETGLVYLQGVNKTDSAGPYIVRDFITDTLSFELILYPKNNQKGNVDILFLDKYKMNGYKDFYCYAFIYKMYNPDKMKDYHADNTQYPAFVKSYLKKNGKWNFVSAHKAKNLSELSQYEIDVMYGNLY